MIDREQLRQAFHRILPSCYSALASVVMLTFVALSVATGSTGHPGGPGSGEIALPLLAFFVVLAFTPFVSVPLSLAAIRRPLSRLGSPDVPRRLQAMLPTEAVVACALWQVAALAGFVAFFIGAAWWFYIACMLITVSGVLVNLPRWNRWLQRADELDRLAASSIPDPL